MRTFLVFGVILTAIEVNGNCPFARPPAKICGVVPTFCKRSRYRTPDGSCNNLKNPRWGTPMSAYERLTHNSYSDGIFRFPHGLPNPRQISLDVFPATTKLDPRWTVILPQWGQVVAHDLSLTAGVPQTGIDDVICCTNGKPIPPVTADSDPRCAPIALPCDDPYNAPEGNTCINFYRTLSSKNANCTVPGKVQEVLSAVTGHLDLSLVYGNSLNQSMHLRSFKNGKLKYVERNGEPWPPQAPNITFTCNNVVSAREPCYLAGDIRVNQNPDLALLQTILLREHNRIAEKLCVYINPHWCDEKCYQEAKRINIAKAQHITYYEFLKIVLGDYGVKKYLSYPGAKGYIDDYDQNVNVQPVLEHSTAAYRNFHTQIVGNLEMYYENRKLMGELRLSDWFNRPSIIESGENSCTLPRGMATQQQNAVDRFFDPEVSQFFFREKDKLFGQDLRAIDIQRSRDHGVAKYIDVLAYCNLSRPTCFDDLKKYIRPKYVELLQKVYNEVEKVELAVAGPLETLVNGTLAGPTFLCIMMEQFRRTRVGDRYFYENGKQDGAFTIRQLNSIRKGTSMSRLLCDNVKCLQTMQADAFSKISEDNPLVWCKSLPKVDLHLWKERP